MKNEHNNRHAVIDLGTNTLKMLIAERTAMGWDYLHDTSLPCRLGEGLKQNGRIMPQALTRTVEALRKALALCSEYKVDSFFPIATEAFRLASNGEEVRLQIKQELGLDFHIITGDEEAKLALEILKHDFPNSLEHYLVIDIGGGSAEISSKYEVSGRLPPLPPFSRGDKSSFALRTSNFELRKSFPLGCVVLTEEFLHSDPIKQTEMESLREYIQSFISIYPKPSVNLSCFGIGGTVSTLGAITLGGYDAEKIHGMRMSLQQIKEISQRLNNITINDRRTIPGMIPGREDILPAGAMLLLEVMNHFQVDSITVSKHGIRYGWLFKTGD